MRDSKYKRIHPFFIVSICTKFDNNTITNISSVCKPFSHRITTTAEGSPLNSWTIALYQECLNCFTHCTACSADSRIYNSIKYKYFFLVKI